MSRCQAPWKKNSQLSSPNSGDPTAQVHVHRSQASWKITLKCQRVYVRLWFLDGCWSPCRSGSIFALKDVGQDTVWFTCRTMGFAESQWQVAGWRDISLWISWGRRKRDWGSGWWLDAAASQKPMQSECLSKVSEHVLWLRFEDKTEAYSLWGLWRRWINMADLQAWGHIENMERCRLPQHVSIWCPIMELGNWTCGLPFRNLYVRTRSQCT